MHGTTNIKYCITVDLIVGRGSSVGIATRYGLDSPGIEFRWGEIFGTRQTDLGAHPASYILIPSSFPLGKAAGGGLTIHPI